MGEECRGKTGGQTSEFGVFILLSLLLVAWFRNSWQRDWGY
jgi:hypothetical protein